MRRSNFSFLAFAFSLVFSGSITALELSHTFSVAELNQLPNQVRFLIFDSPDASLPIEVVDVGPAEYKLEVENGLATISAELLQDIDQETVWMEAELDSQPKGERVAMAIASPGITFASGNNLNMDGNTIVGLEMQTAPGDGTDAVNRAYMDSAVATARDNLGDHTATQNITLGPHFISADGTSKGFYVKGSGSVEFSKTITVAEDALVARHVRVAGLVDASAMYSASVYVDKEIKVPRDPYMDWNRCSLSVDAGRLKYDSSNGNFYGCSNDANDNSVTGDYGWVKLH